MPRTTRVLLSVIQDWHAQGRTIIAVLHDMDLVRRHFPRTLLLTGHRRVWDRERGSGTARRPDARCSCWSRSRWASCAAPWQDASPSRSPHRRSVCSWSCAA